MFFALKRLALPQSKDGDDLIRQRSPRVELCLSFVTSRESKPRKKETRGYTREKRSFVFFSVLGGQQRCFFVILSAKTSS